MIIIAKGIATMGRTKRDKDGNILEHKPASFTFDDDGSCVVIGEIDPETMQIKEPISYLYGDYDAARYLEKVLELLKPIRTPNLPPLRQIVMDALANGDEPFCDYCTFHDCSSCIIKEWKDDYEEEEHYG